MSDKLPKTVDVIVLRNAVSRYSEETDTSFREIADLCEYDYKKFNQILGLYSRGRRAKKARVQYKSAIRIIRAIKRDPNEFGL